MIQMSVLDASIIPDGERDPDAEFVKQHIPGALRFDSTKFLITTSRYHMLPTTDRSMKRWDLGLVQG